MGRALLCDMPSVTVGEPRPNRNRLTATLETGPRAPHPDETDVLVVHLLGVPLRVLQRVREHHGELMREIALLALDPQAELTLPPRLFQLVGLLTGHYGGQPYGGAVERSVEQGGNQSTRLNCADLMCTIGRATALAADSFWTQLDDADSFARGDGLLLTIPNGPVERAFMTWYFTEFVRQASGEAPAPWTGSAD